MAITGIRVVQLLSDLGILNDIELSKLRRWHRYPLRNNPGEQICQIVPIFNMEKALKSKQLIGKKISDLE